MIPLPLPRQKMLQRAKQIAAESPPALLGAIEGVALEEMGKEGVRLVSCDILSHASPAKELNDRRIVGLTELAERGSSLR